MNFREGYFSLNVNKVLREQNVEVISKVIRGFPGGAVVGSPPANAGDMGSSPGLGRSHMPRSGWACEPQLLSPRATTTEAHKPRAHALRQERPPR